MRYYHPAWAVTPAILMASCAVMSTAAAWAQESAANRLSLRGPDGEQVLQVVKDIPAEVRAGETFDYTITVQNVSDSPLVNVMVVEKVEGLQVREAQPAKQQQTKQQKQQAQKQKQQKQQAQSQQKQNQQKQQTQKQNQQKKQAQKQQQQKQQQSKQTQAKSKQQKQPVQQEGNIIRYKVGMLEAGQSRALTVSAVATQAGQAMACMWVDYQPTLCTVIEVVQPDFRLIGRLLFERGIEVEGVEGIYGCDTVFLELEVISTGEAATEPAQVSINLPKGLTTEQGESKVALDLGRLEPNQAVEKQIPLKLDAKQAASELQFPITATAGDLSAKISLPAVNILDPKLELALEAPQEAYIGKSVEMPITVTNPSDSPVLNAAVQVTGVADFDQITADGAQLAEGGAVALGRIDPGQTREFTLLMEAAKPTDATITVAAKAYCVEAVQKQAKVSLIGIPAVLIEVVDQVDPVPVGEYTVYEIEVLNQGTAADTNIQVTATLPQGMQFVEGRGDSKVTAEGQTITFTPVKELAPGDIAAWTVRVKATQPAKARLKVELTSEATDQPIIEQEPTTLYGDSPQSSRQKVSKESESGGQQQESQSKDDSSGQKEKGQSEEQ